MLWCEAACLINIARANLTLGLEVLESTRTMPFYSGLSFM